MEADSDVDEEDPEDFDDFVDSGSDNNNENVKEFDNDLDECGAPEKTKIAAKLQPKKSEKLGLKKEETKKGVTFEIDEEKKEKWEELADKIKEITDKKIKAKEAKQKKKVTFDDQVEDSDLDNEDDDEFGLEDDESEEDDEDLADINEDELDRNDDIDNSDFEDDEDNLDENDFDEMIEESQENLDEVDVELEKDGLGGSDVTNKEDNLSEDIYGRLRDKAGNIVKDNKPAGGEGAYVPPARRVQITGTMDEKRKLQMERLQKQLKGLVNRYGLGPVFTKLFRIKIRLKLTIILLWTFLKPAFII